MKKRKISIQRRVARYIILMISVIVVLLTSLDFLEAFHEKSDRNKEKALTCAKVIESLLNNLYSGNLKNIQNTSSYANTRNILRTLAKSFDFDYIYVYSIDAETRKRLRIFNVAKDDETDNDVIQRHHPGELSVTTINETEQSILDGETDPLYTELDNKWGHEITWYIPYLNEKNELIAVIGIDSNFEIAKNDFIKQFLVSFMVMNGSMVLMLVLLFRMLSKRVVSPIRTISEKMLSFANDSEHKVEKLNITSNDEIGEIATSFDKMVSDISNYISNIEELTEERVENNVQLDVARRIQYGLVPEKTEINNDSFNVFAVTKPAKAVGGDFYDCFQLSDEKLCILIGDVSGKGISAAIFMAMAKTMIREKLMSGYSPAQALNYANVEMCAQNPETLFATTFVAVLDCKNHEVWYANAGHTQPILLKKEPEFLEMDNGIALGLFEDSELKDYIFKLEEEDGILLYTDGVTEAIDEKETFFGMQRLLDSVKNFVSKSADSNFSENVSGVVNAVLDSVRDFSAGKEQFDDTAVLAACFKSANKKSKTEADGSEKHNLPVEISSLSIIKEKVSALLGETPLFRKVMLACDEVFANIVSYSTAKTASFSCEKSDSVFSITFFDDGIPFDPTSETIQEKDFDLLDMGGMGLSVIRQTVSEMNYERKDGWNVLSLRFVMNPV